MALHFGFNKLGWDKDHAEKWDRKFKRLSKTEKEFYHNSLCWVLFGADVSHVSKEMIPVIMARNKLHSVLTPEASKKFITEEYLQKFIGYETNVSTKTDREFMDKVTRINMDTREEKKYQFKSKIAIDNEFKRYLKEVYGVKR